MKMKTFRAGLFFHTQLFHFREVWDVEGNESWSACGVFISLDRQTDGSIPWAGWVSTAHPEAAPCGCHTAGGKCSVRGFGNLPEIGKVQPVRLCLSDRLQPLPHVSQHACVTDAKVLPIFCISKSPKSDCVL